ncbi:MAG TPA: twin-arginine translocation signal domain-containing protein [Planctomycetota bacterium]|nr:twin-arginine translocation signal domain-containing protein [Planctomycetota bacterium]
MGEQEKRERPASRRDFLKTATCVGAGAALAGALPVGAYAAGDETIKVALVGCGGRGTGAAAQAMRTPGPTKLVAMADVFENRLKGSLGHLSKNLKDKVDVPPERQFVGFDAYRKAIDCIAPGGVVCLTTPPGFRPLHLEYAVAKGCHVFMEKSFAVDAPGIRRVLKAGEEATKKNLKIVGGLNQRYSQSNQEAIKQLQSGIIGELVTGYAYRMHGPVGFAPKAAGESDLMHQIRNYSCFTWLNGSFMLDWMIHNLDVICWAKNAWPASAQGHGGRQVRTQPDMLFDHYIVEYTYPDGTRMIAQARHQSNTWGFFADIIHGGTGCATLGEGVGRARICKGHHLNRESVLWEFKGGNDSYQTEHNVLFEAIRKDTPHNDTERCARTAMTGILGRMAAESGQLITWEKALASEKQLAPGLDNFTMESDAPVKPDADGRYPIAMPGKTEVL